MRKAIILYITLLALTGTLFTSCTYFTPKKAKIEAQMDERGRELNSGASLATKEVGKQLATTKAALSSATTNQTGGMDIGKAPYGVATNSVEKAIRANEVADGMITRHENLDGKPIQDQTEVVAALLSENKLIWAKAQEAEADRKAQEQKWIAKQDELQRKLEAYGAKYEEERNEKITRWLKWGGIILAVVGIPIALLVLFPPLAAGLVGLIPSLSGVFGLPLKIGTKMVRAIGDARSELQTQIDYEASRKDIAPKTYTAAEVKEMLDAHLDTHLNNDSDTKIIDHLREKNNV